MSVFVRRGTAPTAVQLSVALRDTAPADPDDSLHGIQDLSVSSVQGIDGGYVVRFTEVFLFGCTEYCVISHCLPSCLQCSVVEFASLSDETIHAYVATPEP